MGHNGDSVPIARDDAFKQFVKAQVVRKRRGSGIPFMPHMRNPLVIEVRHLHEVPYCIIEGPCPVQPSKSRRTCPGRAWAPSISDRNRCRKQRGSACRPAFAVALVDTNDREDFVRVELYAHSTWRHDASLPAPAVICPEKSAWSGTADRDGLWRMLTGENIIILDLPRLKQKNEGRLHDRMLYIPLHVFQHG